MKIKFLLLAFIVLVLLSGVSFAGNDEADVEYEFYPESIVYKYNDHNSSVYEGDSGLSVAYVNSSFDDNNYILRKDTVIGLAYATRGTMKLDEPIVMTHGPLRDWDNMYIISSLKFKNGTVIPNLSISDNDLTSEQKKYFDDYNAQRSEYLMQQQQYAQENLYDYYTVRDRSNSKSKYSYYFGSGRSGVVYTPGSY